MLDNGVKDAQVSSRRVNGSLTPPLLVRLVSWSLGIHYQKWPHRARAVNPLELTVCTIMALSGKDVYSGISVAHRSDAAAAALGQSDAAQIKRLLSTEAAYRK
jgi:hypothetical protein